MVIGQFYAGGSGCGHDLQEPTIEAINLRSWSALISKITKGLFSGKLKPAQLHSGLLEKTLEELNTAAQKGYGKEWIKYKTTKSKTIEKLKENIFLFSGAKTYQQLVEMQSFLVDEKGKLRNYNDFRRKVSEVHKKYNQKYLQAEYQTAKRSAQAARQWNEYQEDKDLFPNLVYRTIGDNRVREEHEALDGIIKALDDPFWDTHYPPNGWRCRCSVQPTDKKVTKGTPKVGITKGFENNVGKTGQIYSEKGHPYFKFPKADEKQLEKAMKKMKPKKL